MLEMQASSEVLDAPVILLGRGGSGTRMLSALSVQLGVFLGNVLNESLDSVEWVDTLYDLAIAATESGIAAGSARDLYWSARLREHAAGILSLRKHPGTALWGWKLPETILAVGPVLRAFPLARVVHLVRHPLTSALRRTHMTSRVDNRIGQAVLPAAYRSCGLDLGDAAGDEPYVHNAVTWAFQVRAATDALRTTNITSLVLRYEDLCANPDQALTTVAQFLEIDVPPNAQAPAADENRINHVTEFDPRAERVWLICREAAEALGYEESNWASAKSRSLPA
jgi:Sulfotransferase family